jgi:uncharacterized lipoprotein NlpE involved in copper resistance
MRAPAVRTLKQRIAELNVRARAEQPPRVVQDVSGNGACFFLAANLGRQVVGHPISRTATDEALDEAAWADRCKLIQYMRSNLETLDCSGHPFRSVLQNQSEFPGHTADELGTDANAEKYLVYMATRGGWADSPVVYDAGDRNDAGDRLILLI